MISNNDQSNKEIKQLIILGNGFDLACGLKSSYSDFFKYRFEQLSGQDTINEYYSKNIKGASMEKFKKLIDESTSFWDIVFITEFINTNENKKLEWNNIEHTIYKVLHYITTNDDSTKLSDNCKNILKNVSYSFKYSEFLFNELQKFENFFGEYILSQKLDNHNYLEKDIPLKLAKIINFDILLTNLRSPQSKDLSVLSFNYTLLKDDISFYSIIYIFCSKCKEFVDSKDYTENTLDSILDNWLNIHGNAIDTSIIFGIDSNIVNNLKHSSLEYNLEIKFTKTFRVALNNSLRSINPLSKNINLITFYGHSLSSADFSYFESIFDMYNLYSSDLKLEFFYGTYDFTWEEKNHKDIDYFKLLKYVNNQNDSIKQSLMTNIYNLLNDYGSSLSNNHGDNLLHRLLLEGRISFREDIGSFKLTEEQIENIKNNK